jgi:hypothetical protein
MQMFRALFIVLLLCTALYAQDHCVRCGKVITERYIIAEGKVFHPEHFLCRYCGKQIQSGFAVENDDFFHPECLSQKNGVTCAYCGKAIVGDYLKAEGQLYHDSCYRDFVQTRCAICGGRINGEYEVDLFGNEFHAAHARELKRCSVCNRLICEPLTRGGMVYGDGRPVCNICYKGAVFNNSQIMELYRAVSATLKTIGLRINAGDLRVVGADKNMLRIHAGAEYSDHMQGFCDISKTTKTVNGKPVSTKTDYQLYVLNGMPVIYTEAVIAHELMHIWLQQNTANIHEEKLKEGACNFVSFKFLQMRNTPEAELQIVMLEKDPDPIYGDGFREVKARFLNSSFSSFLNYLRVRTK